jgi:hypothetical protein
MPLEMKSNWFVLDLSHAQYYIFSVFHCASNTIAREFQFFVAHSTFRFVVCLLIDNAQGDLFLEPQIYGGIKRFGIDMVSTDIASWSDFPWPGFMKRTWNIQLSKPRCQSGNRTHLPLLRSDHIYIKTLILGSNNPVVPEETDLSYLE